MTCVMIGLSRRVNAEARICGYLKRGYAILKFADQMMGLIIQCAALWPLGLVQLERQSRCFVFEPLYHDGLSLVMTGTASIS